MSLIRSQILDVFSDMITVEEIKSLTRSSVAEGVELCVMRLLIATSKVANALIACCKKNDGDKRQQQRRSSSDPPLRKDDAEVFRRPCK